MKALIIHTGGGLGDVLLARPVADALAQAGYRVDFLVRQATSAALMGHPNIDEVLVTAQKNPSSVQQSLRWVKILRKRSYDLALLLWGTSRWAFIMLAAGIPRRVGQDSRLSYAFTFTDRVRLRSEHGDKTTHWTQILLDYPRALGIVPKEVTIQYEVDDKHIKLAQQMIAGFDFKANNGPLIGFHCGKGLALSPSRWPIAHFSSFIKELQHVLKARVILTGGPTEVELVGAIEAGLQLPALNVAGQTSLTTLAGVIKSCDVFICPDSGPMHLAAALGTPVVGIFALDSEFPQRWAPWGTSSKVICPPRPACPPGCKKETCQNFSCYLKVAPSQLSLAVKELLKEQQEQESRTKSMNNLNS